MGVAATTERERAYDLPDGVRIPELAGRGGVARVAGGRTDVLETVYHDTPDLRLARARTALRRRRGGRDAGWHLKVHLTDERRTEEQRPDGATPPVDLLDRVRAVARGQPLAPAARVVTRRRERELRARDGRVLALLAEDDVEAEDLVTGTQHSWREVEVELVDGDERLFGGIEARLRGAGARPLRASKLERTLGARLAGLDTSAAGGGPAGTVLGYLRTHRDALVAAYPGARAGDADAVHDMRVAARRLRATLRTFRGMWERPAVARARAELSWLGRRLGALRDPQVMATRLGAAVSAEPPELVFGPVRARLRQRFAGAGGPAHARLRAALGSQRFLELLTALDTLADTARHRRARWVRGRVRRALERADARMDRALANRYRPQRGAGRPGGDELLHQARKAYKRARYGAEALRATGGRPARRLVRRLKAVQDALGAHQDGVVARAELRRQAVRAFREGENTFTYGLLYARTQESAARARDQVDRAVRRAARPKVRSWLA